MIEFTEGLSKALTELIHHLRPAWDHPGITTAIHQATTRRDFATVAHVAIDAACDPTARTPAVIVTRHRTTQTSIQNMAPPSPADRKPCPSCHQIHTPNQDGCHRPGKPSQQALADARQAIAEAKAKTAAEADLYPSDDPSPPF